MGATSFAAKWGAGPTLAATLIGGATLGATVAVFQYEAIGTTIGILSETVPRVGPAIAEGKAAVGDKTGAAPQAPLEPAPGDPAVPPTAAG